MCISSPLGQFGVIRELSDPTQEIQVLENRDNFE